MNIQKSITICNNVLLECLWQHYTNSGQSSLFPLNGIAITFAMLNSFISGVNYMVFGVVEL